MRERTYILDVAVIDNDVVYRGVLDVAERDLVARAVGVCSIAARVGPVLVCGYRGRHLVQFERVKRVTESRIALYRGRGLWIFYK